MPPELSILDILGPGEPLQVGHRPETDEMEFTDGRAFLRISCTSMAVARPSPNERVENWVANHLPEPGTTVRIPDWHF
jgi:hypothetical protein